MQTQSKLFDDLAKMASGALSAASGLREELNLLIQQQFDRFIASRDLVSREEFAAVEAMAAKAREEQEALAERVATLEKQLEAATKAAKPQTKPTTRKSAARPKTAATARRTGGARRTKGAPKNADGPSDDDK